MELSFKTKFSTGDIELTAKASTYTGEESKPESAAKATVRHPSGRQARERLRTGKGLDKRYNR